MSKIFKNYFYNFAYQILVILVPLVVAPYLSRVVGAEGLGIYSYVNSTTYIICMVAMLGVYNYGNRQVAYDRDNVSSMNRTFWELMLLRAILGVMATAVYLFVAISNPDYILYFSLYYFWMLAYILDCTWFYVGVEDMRPAVMKNVFAKLLSLVCIFLFVKSSDDLWIYVLILSTSTLIANLAAYPHLRFYIKKPDICIKKLLYHTKGSLALFLPTAATLVYLQLDKVLIVLLTNDTAQLGFYDYAEKIITIPLTLVTVLSTVMMPRIANEFAKGNDKKVLGYLGKASNFSFLLAAPLAVGLASISHNLISWYLGDAFSLTATLIIVLIPIVLFNSFESILGKQYLTATNNIMPLTIAYVLAAIVNVAINFILLPRVGSLGAAVATDASSLVTVVVEILFLKRILPIKTLGSSLPKYLFCSLIMGFFVVAAGFLPISGPALTLIQITVGAVVYFMILHFSKDANFHSLETKLISVIKK